MVLKCLIKVKKKKREELVISYARKKMQSIKELILQCLKVD